MIDSTFIPLVDYDDLFWLVYLVPDSNYRYVEYPDSGNTSKNSTNSSKKCKPTRNKIPSNSNTCGVQDRQDSDTDEENAAEGSIISSTENSNTIAASNTANLPVRLTVPDVNYGYRPVELLHDRLGHVGHARLERTKNRSVGLEN